MALALVVVLVAATVQRSVGLGFGLVASPVLAIAWPELVPAAVLLVGTPLTFGMVARDRASVVRADLPPLLLGAVAGIGAGALLLARVPPAVLTVMVGAAIVCAVALTAGRLRVPATRGWLAVVGAAAGAMGTTAATPSPPLAIAYQDVDGARLRGTLALVITLANALAIAGLASVGALEARHLRAAALLLPALAAGAWLGGRLAPRVDARLRTAVLVVAAVSGLAAVARGLLSL